MSDLKACPFCGRIPDIEDCGERRWFIRCKCGIAQDKLFFQKCDAVRDWNKRKELRVKDTNVPITDTISRQAAIDAKQEFRNPNVVRNTEARTAYDRTYANGWNDCNSAWINVIKDLPSAQPERLTNDDFETIRIHLNAYKEKLCNQQRWEEAEEYQRIIDRFMAFASAQPSSKREWYQKGYLDGKKAQQVMKRSFVEYVPFITTWLMDYQARAAALKGRYTAYEVLGWVVNDWMKENPERPDEP